MKKLLKLLFGTLCISSCIAAAHAQSIFDDAKARIGFEYEYEKNAKGDGNNTALAVIPGIQFKKNAWVSRAEFYLEGNQDKMWQNGSTGNTTETKVGARLRKDFAFDSDWGGYVRGFIGRAMSNEGNYNFYCVEPAIKYDFNKVYSLTVSYRMVRNFSGSDHEKNKLRIGPNINIDEHNSVELRWVRAWDAHTGEHIADAYLVEYAYKF